MNKTKHYRTPSIVSDCRIGQLVKLAHNDEAVKIIYKSNTRVTVKPLKPNEHGSYPLRDVSIACGCYPYKGQLGFVTGKDLNISPNPLENDPV